jgi:hypothetical protein
MDQKISALTADTLPATGDLLPIVNVGAGSTQKITLSTIITFIAAAVKTLTNTTFDTAGTGNVFKIAGTAISAITGTGSNVLATSPTITTPTLAGPTVNSTVQVVSVMAAQAINGALSNIFTRTLAASETFTQSGFVAGQCFMVEVKQGSGTTYTVTWFSGISWVTSGGTAPVQTTTTNGITVYGFRCTGTNTFLGYLVSTQ